MVYTALFIHAKNFNTRKLIFEGEHIPTREELEQISEGLGGATYHTHLVFVKTKYLPRENGFLLTKYESSSWSGVRSALRTLFENQLPGVKIILKQ